MPIIKHGLGRGLGSLIPQKHVITTEDRKEVVYTSLELAPQQQEQSGARKEFVLFVSPQKISVNPFQPRRDFNHQDLEDLVASIKEHGLIQPLVVSDLGNGNFQLIAGERRLRASRILDLAEIPVIVREATDHEKLELALIENIQRQRLNPMEEAYAYKQLIEEFNFTQEQVGQKVGKSRPKIANSLRLLSLPSEIISAIEQGIISEGHAKVIAGLDKPEDKIRLFKKVIQHKMNVREVENQAREVNRRTRTFQTIDAILQSKQDSLRKALGTKVEIRPTGKSGRIIIEYYSVEDLDGIISNIAGE